MPDNRMSLPNTYIIGVQKAGTTSLHNWLSQHPDIYGPNHLKDVDYFTNPEFAHRAEEKLNADFAGHSEESIILQSQVNYIFYPEALKRISELTPDAKLIVIFRDPVDRAISAYRYFKKMGKEDRKAKEALLYNPVYPLRYSKVNSDFAYLEHGLYGKQVEMMFKYFNREQVLILQFEELKNNPSRLCQEVFRFLDIDIKFKPTFSKRNQTGKVRFEWLQERLIKTSSFRQIFIKYLVDWWLSPKKRQLLRKNIIDLNTQDLEHVSNEDFSHIRAQLGGVFTNDKNKFSNIIGTKPSI